MRIRARTQRTIEDTFCSRRSGEQRGAWRGSEVARSSGKRAIRDGVATQKDGYLVAPVPVQVQKAGRAARNPGRLSLRSGGRIVSRVPRRPGIEAAGFMSTR